VRPCFGSSEIGKTWSEVSGTRHGVILARKGPLAELPAAVYGLISSISGRIRTVLKCENDGSRPYAYGSKNPKTGNLPRSEPRVSATTNT
jgi:hypothetical protein